MNIFSSAKFSEVFTLCVFTLWLFPIWDHVRASNCGMVSRTPTKFMIALKIQSQTHASLELTEHTTEICVWNILIETNEIWTYASSSLHSKHSNNLCTKRQRHFSTTTWMARCMCMYTLKIEVHTCKHVNNYDHNLCLHNHEETNAANMGKRNTWFFQICLFHMYSALSRALTKKVCKRYAGSGLPQGRFQRATSTPP